MNLTDANEVTAMVEGYLRAALWSTPVEREDGECQSSPFGSEHNPPLEQVFCYEDIVAATLDCLDFLRGVEGEDYEDAPEDDVDPDHLATVEALHTMDAHQAGHDFWLTRERHGAGFWDRGLGVAGDRLSDAAKTYGEGGLSVQYHGDGLYRATFGNGEPPDFVDDWSDDRETCGHQRVETCGLPADHTGKTPHRYPVHS